MANVLVTGGAGYIGSHTAKMLSRAGYVPVVLDNLSSGHRRAVKWGPLVEGDVSDVDFVRETLARFGIEAVIHFAANIDVGESMANPRKYFRNNAANTLSLLDAVLDAGVRHIVFSSTCATYGVPREIPIDERHPQVPMSPYGESKLFIERVLRWYGEIHGLGWVALRYFNAAGCDPDGEIGEEHDPETHLVPLAVAAALGRGELRIFGTDFPTPDGTAVRDYVHVTDLAGAHVRALEHLRGGEESLAANLGTGTGHSVREVIAAVETASGRKVPARESPRRAGDPPRLIADARLARAVLRWEPRYPELASIVETAWRWQASRGEE